MRQLHAVLSRITGPTKVCLGGLALAMLLSGCGTAITRTTLTPPLAGMGSYQWTRGTINDGSGGPIAACTPATPPAPAFPAPPTTGELLVGYQDWRNTVVDPPGVMCPSSRASRWHGLMVFDMSAVAANLRASPHRLLTASLSYRVGSWLKVPQSAQALDLCVRSLELARGYETPAPFVLVELDPRFGDFPQSAPSRLGATTLPSQVPLGQVTSSGQVTVDPAGPNPTVTVDVSLLLSDWAERLAQEPVGSVESGRFGLAVLPVGPSIQQLGLTNPPPSPVPPNRATARCTSILKNASLTVTVGR
ncbi:hypothetical protein [Paucibacter sp. XJ19-41]|uniref:hypothetical protein n=1 Tax=Paucibacter sp. XJ19-41 TaxID=2927824 RepID=UPI00234BE5C2|nr:hypothetical protein [Paucibacter sp. XJ19-41]MDC6171341.1 hypothetical protein [Paucibacter sp. XJ19-41]